MHSNTRLPRHLPRHYSDRFLFQISTSYCLIWHSDDGPDTHRCCIVCLQALKRGTSRAGQGGRCDGAAPIAERRTAHAACHVDHRHRTPLSGRPGCARTADTARQVDRLHGTLPRAERSGGACPARPSSVMASWPFSAPCNSWAEASLPTLKHVLREPVEGSKGVLHQFRVRLTHPAGSSCPSRCRRSRPTTLRRCRRAAGRRCRPGWRTGRCPGS